MPEARTPATAPVPVPEPPPLPPQEIKTLVEKTIELLEQGQEEQAEANLQRVLKQEPSHRLAGSLMRQMSEDPQAMLGRESFAYRVQPGETLSRIAGRFLGDIYMFYALARYNGIKVPRQLAGGQSIRIPGKAPPPGAHAPTPPAAPPQPVPSPPVSAPTAPPLPAEPQPDPKAQEQRERREAIVRHTRAARTAFAKQDLDGAIAAWDRVLELDPTNATARLERQRAVDLKERLKTVK